MKKLALYTVLLFLAACTVQKPAGNLEWVQLFNGKDLNDWTIKIKDHDLNENYGNTFRIENGNMVVRYDQYASFDKQYGHIFYKKPFSYYLLGVEYRFTGNQATGGEGWAFRNSGAMLHGQDPATMSKNQDFPNSIEVQFLGGSGTNTRSTANCCTPGTDIVMNGKQVKTHCTNSKSPTFHGDQWVRVEVLVLGDSLMVHYVNGEPVMRYERPQLDPVNGEQEGKLIKSGTISMQSESHPVDFRKVEIVDLEKYAGNPKKLEEAVQTLLAQKRVPAQ